MKKFNKLLAFVRKTTQAPSISSKLVLSLLLAFASIVQVSAQQKNPSRTLLQGFWWGSWSDKYPNAYYNYLTRMAPRLRMMGVDAIWVFPPQKAAQKEVKSNFPLGLTYPKFYEPFDNYDLGDKYQKGTTATRGGTKDEYLRMIAVMHANGIDVIQDIVLNHVGMGGAFMNVPYTPEIDPAAPTWNPPPPSPPFSAQEHLFQQSKTYRYVSYATPVIDNLESNYGSRIGRWPKNYENFHPNPNHFCLNFGDPGNGDPVCNSIFGNNLHDICMFSNAIGQSSDPNDYEDTNVNNNNYTRDRMAEWMVWFVKQAGFDGVRLDAVKHLEPLGTKDMVDQLQSNAGWASKGTQMFAVGEYIDGKAVMDNWVNFEQDRCGTFDFDLREQLRQMIIQNGNYMMSNLPGSQQNKRDRTVPVINNHDSFRPDIDPATGQYTNYASGGPFLAPVDPNSSRLPAAYALASAVDGSPSFFIEDLFKLNDGSRYTHDPSDPAQLKTRPKLENIIWARKALNFAGGAYKVRSAEAGVDFGPVGNETGYPADLLVIERSGKAVIGINDDGTKSQSCWIDTDFPKGITVKDYSGNTNYLYTIPIMGPDQRIQVTVPPPSIDAMGNAAGGYVIIGPVGAVLPNAIQKSTTQEWEMANDLGDSHPLSLKQGGAVPDFGIWFNPRTVGRIFSEAGKNIHLELTPAIPNKLVQVTLMLNNSDGTVQYSSTTGSGVIMLDYQANQTDYYTIKVANGLHGSKGQKVFVKATYTAPQSVDPLLYNISNPNNSFVGEINKELDGLTVSAYPNPSDATAGANVTIEYTLSEQKEIRLSVFDPDGKLYGVLEDGVLAAGTYKKVLKASELIRGIYVYKVETDKGSTYGRIQIR
jgi:alpha-amylase